MKTKIAGTDAMETFAREFISQLSPVAGGATIIALSGDLGAGKTTLAQGIARALGVEEAVTSPTFVLEKVYELGNPSAEAGALFSASAYRSGREKVLPPPRPWTHLIHIDAYRLVSEHELEVLGWHEMAQNPGNLIVIEWPEMVAELIPVDAIRITFSGSGEVRDISIN
ncbi:tRNA (adenosine(37)-N6)-threonylcarbamoyltransferase complex ATPase subunit type 1 TsaE [Candidatus Kaiserbacteria bacterium]|nr:tRNA (adenosine(37)-N6)-threonylcarbamoyltransferase complex ATPase subunit type 1 TsaE [Candidatus Kaiserbacteria bacterium]